MRESWSPFGREGNFSPSDITATLEQQKGKIVEIQAAGPLRGTVRGIGGGKNMTSPILLAACSLNPFDRPSVLRNVPRISELAFARYLTDVANIAEINFQQDGSVSIKPSSSKKSFVPSEIGPPSHIAIVAAGFFVGNLGVADIPVPGGDKLGGRTVDTHVQALQDLGVTVNKYTDNKGFERLRFSAPENGLQGGDVWLRYPRITATGMTILAAAKAKGMTIIHNAALDPEVDALISFYKEAGLTIKRGKGRLGEPIVEITPEIAKELHRVEYTIPIDRTAVVTYAVAAIATKSEKGIFVEGAQEDELSTFLSLLAEMNRDNEEPGYRIEKNGIQFFYKGLLKAPERTVISMNKPYVESEDAIGIYTDWQPFVSILLSQAEGRSILYETAHPDRLEHLRVMQNAGARDSITFSNHPAMNSAPLLFDPGKSEAFHCAHINGGFSLNPIDITGSDIRFAAWGVIQSLVSGGKIRGVDQIYRGYDGLIDKLIELGADIAVR